MNVLLILAAFTSSGLSFSCYLPFLVQMSPLFSSNFLCFLFLSLSSWWKRNQSDWTIMRSEIWYWPGALTLLDGTQEWPEEGWVFVGGVFVAWWVLDILKIDKNARNWMLVGCCWWMKMCRENKLPLKACKYNIHLHSTKSCTMHWWYTVGVEWKNLNSGHYVYPPTQAKVQCY